MTAYEKARNNPRQFKALTSLSVEKFDILLPTFESKWEDFIQKYNLDGTPRLRKYVPKNEKQLPAVEDKLFFLLCLELFQIFHKRFIFYIMVPKQTKQRSEGH